jgi:hypothetical protein
MDAETRGQGDAEMEGGDSLSPLGEEEPALSLSKGQGEEVETRGRGDAEKGDPTGQIAGLEAAVEASRQELEAAQQAAAAAEQRAVEAHRRALLAEHKGQVVDELLQGATVEELEASVETARAAYARVAEAARSAALQQLHEERVPPSAGERGTSDLESLSPLNKIARGLAG